MKRPLNRKLLELSECPLKFQFDCSFIKLDAVEVNGFSSVKLPKQDTRLWEKRMR